MHNIESLQMLQYLESEGIINLSDLQRVMQMKENQQYLDKHKFNIWQGKDGNWYTYLPDDSKQHGRVLKKRASKEKIEDMVIEFYKKATPTFQNIFNAWSTQKLELQEIKKGTYDRYVTDFNRYFVSTKMADKRITDLNEEDLELFVKKTIVEQKVTKKSFTNFCLILKGIYKYARKNKYITLDIGRFLDTLDVSKNIFAKRIMQADEEVFSEIEIPRVIDFLKEDVTKKTNLGLLLIFATGIRVGELSALKWSDINGNMIHIQRTEIFYKEYSPEQQKDVYVYAVSDYPKSEAGDRYIIVPDNAMWILKRLRFSQHFSEFIFTGDNGERIKASSFRNRIRTVCETLGIKVRSPHKIRKTYGTTLIDSGVPESIIIDQMGHSGINCTKQYYFYSNKNKNTKETQLNIASIPI